MSRDAGKLGQVAAEVMDAIEAHDGDNVRLDEVVVVAALLYDEDDTTYHDVIVKSSSKLRYVMRGVLAYGVDTVVNGEELEDA